MASGAADDPWDWSVDRVVQELCTDNRIWTPRSRNSSIGDPVAMEAIVRDQEIDGEILLCAVNDQYLKDAGVKALGRRWFVLVAAEELRLKSTEYSKRAQNNVAITRSVVTHIPVGRAISQADQDLETGPKHRQQVATTTPGPLGDSNMPAALVHTGPPTVSPSQAFSARVGRVVMNEYLSGDPDELEEHMASMEASQLEILQAVIASAQMRRSTPKGQMVIASRPASFQGELSHLPDGPVASLLGAVSHLPDGVETAEGASQGTTLVSEEPESKRQKLVAPTTVSNDSTLNGDELPEVLMSTPAEGANELLREARAQTPGRDVEIDIGSMDSGKKRKRSESIAEQEHPTGTDETERQSQPPSSPLPATRKRANLMCMQSFTLEEAAALKAKRETESVGRMYNHLGSLNVNLAKVHPGAIRMMVAEHAFPTPITQSDNTHVQVDAGSSREPPRNGDASQDSKQPTDGTSGQFDAQLAALSETVVQSNGDELQICDPQSSATQAPADAKSVSSTDSEVEIRNWTPQPRAPWQAPEIVPLGRPLGQEESDESDGPLITHYSGPHFRKRSLPVDSVFYEGTELGEDLSLPDSTGDLQLWRSPLIPINTRAFVNGRMKYFLSSKPLTFMEEPRLLVLSDQQGEEMAVNQHAGQVETGGHKGDENCQAPSQLDFTVVVPYHERLQDRPGSIVQQRKPSCTVFFTADDDKIHAERTLLDLYPEIKQLTRSQRHGIRPGYTWPTLPEVSGSQKLTATKRGLRKDVDEEKGPKPRGDRKFFLGRNEPITQEELEDRIVLRYGYVENDVVLPVFGDSGSENDYSTDVIKEIAREAGESALDVLGHSKKPRKKDEKQGLSRKQVNEVLDEALKAFEIDWTKRHLPKLEKAAWQIWTKSQKQETTDLQIMTARGTINHNQQRLSAQRDKFMSAQWNSKKLLRVTCAAMERTVFAINELQWKVALLESETAPSKPLRKPTISKRKEKKVHEAHDDDEAELLSTDDGESVEEDEVMSDFVVSDDENQFGLVDENEILQQQCAAAEDEPFQSEAEADVEDELDLPGDVEADYSPRSGRSRSTSQVEPSTPTAAPQSNGTAQFSSFKTLGNSTSLSQSDGPSALPTGRKANLSNGDGSTLENTIDLTASPPAVIDLITPEKSEAEKKSSKSRADKVSKSSPSMKINFNKSTSRNPSPSPFNLKKLPDPKDPPSLYDPATINRYSYAAWCEICDGDRLLIKVFYNMSLSERSRLLDYLSTLGFSEKSRDKFWNKMRKVIVVRNEGGDCVEGMQQVHFDTLSRFVELFHIYINGHNGRFVPLSTPLDFAEGFQQQMHLNILGHRDEYFIPFWKICSKMGDYIGGSLNVSIPSTPSRSSRNGKGKEAMWSNDIDEEEDGSPRSSVKRRRDTTMSTSEQIDTETSPRPKRRRKVHEDASARNRREQDKERQSQQEHRRTQLQEKLVRSGRSEDLDLARFVINATGDQESSIRIHDHIAGSIKPHQIDGVRFLWNQIVAGGQDEEMQGCLLAHTMGLGKTMQTITLLVAIAEAASNINQSISSQVPEGLRVSKTLVLCPPSLIDNWLDELLTWAPRDMLGEIRKIDASINNMELRLQTIGDWYEDGGVLVMGYQMLSMIIENKERKKTKEGKPIWCRPISDAEKYDTVAAQLLEGPNIVVADEAHHLKNPDTDIAKTAQLFRTKSRIALTGSPLANMLSDYYHMINFVAPGYLGPLVEFTAKYVEPIQTGLYQDSNNSERRKALKMLKVLNDDLAPKINRADMSVLKHDLSKTEFVITIPLTDIQKKAYTIYVRSMLQGGAYSRTKSGDITHQTLWHWLAILSLLCNHPACFKSKLLQRKDDAQKTLDEATADSNQGTDADGIDVNASVWKSGVSENLIAQETRLFEQEDLDIESEDLSYKVMILCQILDAAKAAGDKTLVFSESIPTLDYLKNLFKKQGRNYDRLDGKTPMPRRQQLTKDFNHGKTDVCLISTGAGGLGLNLQGANRVIIFDFKFNPTKEEQAVGRAYRIGQKKHTYVYRFVAGGTFEASIHNKAIYKMQLASRVIDKKKPIAYAKKSLGEYLFEPKDVPQLDLSEFQGMDPLVLDKILASQSNLSTIRGIVQTNTFERDDNDKLTAEEEKEVESMQVQEKMKRSDPKQWERKFGRSSAVNAHPQVSQGNRPSISSGNQAQNQSRRPSTASAGQSRIVGESSKTGAQLSATPGTETRILPPSSKLNASTPVGPPDTPIQSSALTNGYTSTYPPAATSVPRPLSPILGASTQRESLQSLPPSMSKTTRHQTEESESMEKDTRLRTALLLALKAIKGSTSREDEALAYYKAEDVQTQAHASFPGLKDRRALFNTASITLKNSPDLCRQIMTSQLSVEDYIRNLMQSSSQPTPTSSSSSGQTEIDQSAMYTAMALQPNRPRVQSLRTPVARLPPTSSSTRNTRPQNDDEILERVNKKRRLRGDIEIPTSTRSPARTPRLPSWAEKEINDTKLRHRQESRASSTATPAPKKPSPKKP